MKYQIINMESIFIILVILVLIKELNFRDINHLLE